MILNPIRAVGYIQLFLSSDGKVTMKRFFISTLYRASKSFMVKVFVTLICKIMNEYFTECILVKMGVFDTNKILIK